MTQTSEVVFQSTQELWATYEGLSDEFTNACRKTDARYADYKQALAREHEAWDASQVAYAAYRTAVDGGRK
ncbi:MAG TPA: hypothetical protein VIS06_19105 [Mycobacteriales bacterium]|jgi:hypothetical protein